MAPADTRRSVEFEGRRYTLDSNGFLEPPEQWDEAFARGMAVQCGVLGPMLAEHWRVILYLREKFTAQRTVPLVVTACVDTGLRLGRLRQLFPTGYHRGACRIAGLNYAFLAATNIWLTYENYTTLKTHYRLTETGFLADFDRWNERFALMVLSESAQPVALGGKHREIITFLRQRYRETGDIPTVYETCKVAGIDHAELRELFPEGYRRGACRAAGLPFFA